MVRRHFRGHYVAVVAFITVLLVPLLIALIPPITASAATSCAWNGKKTVVCKGITYTEVSTNGNTMHLASGQCNTLTIDNYKNPKPTGILITGSLAGSSPGCQENSPVPVQLSNSWGNTSSNPNSTCQGISEKGVDCSKIPLGCPGSTKQGPVSPTKTLKCPYPPSGNWTCQAKECDFPNGEKVPHGKQYKQCPSSASVSSDGTCTCSDGSTPDSSGSCPQTSGTCGSGSFDWIVCPTDALLQDLAQRLMQFMQTLLNINANGQDGIFGTGAKGSAYYRAWNSFRILGTAVIVIAGLVMVSAQAFGFEFLDAYTIRKVLPRLFIAIIGMSLSWPILNFVVNFFNILGQDIQGLMYAPFSTLPNHAGLSGGIVSWTFTAVIAGAFLLGYGAVLLPILGAGALALLIAILILVVRQIGVTLLVILAPFAIATYVLPNTKKVWDIWRDNFLGLMFMYPIVMMLIAAGQIFGAVGKSGTFTQQLIGIVAFFIPYFMIPLAFRMATGFISQISGLVNDRSKGAFDRLRNTRNEMMAGQHQKLMDEKATGIPGRMSGAYRRASLMGRHGSLSRTSKGRDKYEAYLQKMGQVHSGKGLEEDAGFQSGDDETNALLAQGGMTRRRFIDDFSAARARALMASNPGMAPEVAEAQAREAAGLALRRAEQSYGAEAGSNTMRLTALKALGASNGAWDEGNLADSQRAAYGAVGAAVADGLMSASDGAAILKSNRARVDRSANSWGETIGMVQTVANRYAAGDRGDALMSSGVQADGSMGEVQQLSRSVRNEVSARELVSTGHTRSVRLLAPEYANGMYEAMAEARTALQPGGAGRATAEQVVGDSAADLMSIYDSIGHESAAKQKEFAKVLGSGIRDDLYSDGQMVTVRSLMEKARSQPVGPVHGEHPVLERRREFSNREEANQAGGGAGGGDGGAIGPHGEEL